jgi:hypothetical protein
MLRGWRAEPVAIAAAIRACILAATAFGLAWTPEQIASLMLAVETVLALVLRAQVTTDATLTQAGTSRAEVHDAACAHGVHMVPVVDGRVVSRSAGPDV